MSLLPTLEATRACGQPPRRSDSAKGYAGVNVLAVSSQEAMRGLAPIASSGDWT